MSENEKRGFFARFRRRAEEPEAAVESVPPVVQASGLIVLVGHRHPITGE